MIRTFITIALILISSVSFAQKRPYSTHEVFFKDSNYELNVYKIYGRKDGKTMFILGGIQGDEPGGFLSADLYSDLRLEKGNLIVVPRANFKSIIMFDRGPDGDMNRRFLDEPEKGQMDKVVAIIKKLMQKSDVFLNLHDGWGYHTPKYIDKWRNPKRFGQSIITDADVFKCDGGRELDLRTPAEKVLEGTNAKIGEEKYFLHYFNTKTDDPKTLHTDMRKTATFYALKNYCLPAYGVESSKNLPTTEMKVLHHNYAVNEFMKIYDIVPEAPTIFLKKPKLEYAVVNVNDEPRIVESGASIIAHKGDIVELTHIESNYKRGVSCDILGYGDLNDIRKKIELKNDTVVVFRKDNRKMGYINLRIKKANGNGHYFVFVIKHNGKKKLLLSGDTYNVTKGDKIELISAFTDASCGHEYPMNMKGYVPPKVTNNNGDDRGFIIPMTPSAFLSKYSKNRDKRTYPVVVNYNGVEMGKIFISMSK